MTFLSDMDKTAVVQTLVMSERNNSLVTIKTIHADKPIIGAVQKVLNQVIIFKAPAAEPITLTFADIESVASPSESIFGKVLTNISKTLHRRLRWT